MKKMLHCFSYILFLVLLVSCSNPATTSPSPADYSEQPKVKFDESQLIINSPQEATNYSGQDYYKVQKELEQAGFKNITTQKLKDLTEGNIDLNGLIDLVSIDDDTEYTSETNFSPYSKVVISYHTLKEVEIPLSSDATQNIKHPDLAKLFSDAGFTNITVDMAYDQDPDTLEGDFYNEVTVGNLLSFHAGSSIPYNTSISILCHMPYEKYDATIHIDFAPNLIFSKYDVDYELDGKKLGTMVHGTDTDIELRLKEGTYVLSFKENGSVSNCTDVELNLTDDFEAEYDLFCHNGNINLYCEYQEYKHAAGEGQAMAPDSASNFKYQNYKDVVEKLENAGFTNISTAVLYDIVFGWTEEGEVASVSIDGNQEFQRGDVFTADLPITVTYHMRQEDDPAPETKETDLIAEEHPVVTDNPAIETPSDLPVNETPEATAERRELSYSTNDLKTAKKGNSGVFAYRLRGQNYDLYYVIDFDEGYVYFFTEGNGSETCDKIKITSGTLNDTLIFTYHDGDSAWDEGLCFKWKNQPDKVVWSDGWGLTNELSATDLDDALVLINSKVILEY